MDGFPLSPGRTLLPHAGFPAASADSHGSFEDGRSHPADFVCGPESFVPRAVGSDRLDDLSSPRDVRTGAQFRALGEIRPQRLLTLKEFVEQSRLSESTVRRRARDGSLPVVQLGGKGKKLLFPIDALEQIQHSTPFATPDGEVDNIPLTPSTGTPTASTSGPRPRWARNLTRRPR